VKDLSYLQGRPLIRVLGDEEAGTSVEEMAGVLEAEDEVHLKWNGERGHL
jgi:hypothetical protein